ncbi:hypothetical protein NQD34_007582 [Periophthalmus magnuspinnatus]|nr:hypothetical protein NQD34_007582 [Periophthalmus magnuspinnatus]
MSDVFPKICCSHSSSLGVTVLSAPMTMGTTDAITFQGFSSSSLTIWYFSSFLFPDVPITWCCNVNHNGFALLFIHHRSVLLVYHHSVSLYLKLHRILAWSFSTTFGCVFHLDLWVSSPYSAQMCLCTKPTAWIYLFMYAFSAAELKLKFLFMINHMLEL